MQPLLSSNGHVALRPCTDTFPFTCELSLAPLVAFWQQTMHHEHPVEGTLAVKVQQVLQETPALLESITDGSVIGQYQEVVDTLMSVIFPRASWHEVYAAALRPFHMQSFYATPAFARRLLTEDGWVHGRANVEEATRIEQIRILYAYALVLERVYGLEVDFAYPLIYTATDPDTGLDCHFKAVWNTRFVEVRTVGEIPPLTETLRNQLLANLGNIQGLMALLPPEHFIFQGFIVLHALEVTDQEVLSSLKRDLIERESLISTTRFHSLQSKLRTLFKRPELCFSLAARQDEQIFMLHAEAEIAYHAILNPRLGTLYQQRKDFEDSVMQLNETLAAYLESEENKAQAMLPHYFEQHKSDGIEYGIYVGASLLEHNGFDMVHVHNLRLWQLLVTCGLARQSAQVKEHLKVPLEVAHLILVQHTPMAIRFRFDEKRFDIDGAYNMRYEIVKKRIDKALVKGTNERLTQPGKIAIVYSQPREALEYGDYIEYLQASGELTEEVEALALEDLPGAQGLQALRVTVAMQPQPSAQCDNADERLDAPGRP